MLEPKSSGNSGQQALPVASTQRRDSVEGRTPHLLSPLTDSHRQLDPMYNPTFGSSPPEELTDCVIYGADHSKILEIQIPLGVQTFEIQKIMAPLK